MILGFCGLAGSGKSTAAQMVVDFEPDCARVRFAGPLKAMMRALGLTEAEIEGDRKETPCDLLGGRTPRYAMQTIGTEWGRDLISPDIWVAAWRREVARLRAAGVRHIVVDDVRFVNEASAIWAEGGAIVRLMRPGAASASGAGHASESLGFPWDYEIANSGGLEALRAEVETLAVLLAGPVARGVAHV